MVESGSKPNPINRRREIPLGGGNLFYPTLSKGRSVNIPSLGIKLSTLGMLHYKNASFDKRWSEIKSRERKVYETK